MLFSQEKKFVFVEVPKTGTSSIASFFHEFDPTVLRNSLHKSDGSIVHVKTHTTALEIQKILGEEAKNYTLIGFIRDPMALLVSKYLYYRTGRGRQWATDPTSPVGLKVRVLFARVFPFWVWATIYPYKCSASFILDSEGNCLIDYLGRFENLDADFSRIFSNFGYNPKLLKLTKTNSTIKPIEPFFIPSFTRILIQFKTKKDTNIIEMVKELHP